MKLPKGGTKKEDVNSYFLKHQHGRDKSVSLPIGSMYGYLQPRDQNPNNSCEQTLFGISSARDQVLEMGVIPK